MQYVYTMRRVGKVVPPKREILKNISLSFFPGAKIGVLGLNGSGKSTLLKIMAGEDKNFEGEAVAMPDLKIGFLKQEPELDPAKTVREEVESGLGEVMQAKAELEKVYAAYAEPDADSTSSRTVFSGSSSGSCLRKPILRSGMATASPSKFLSSPAMILSSVDLPEPLRPSTPILAPGKNDRLMSRRMVRLGGTTLDTRFIVKMY